MKVVAHPFSSNDNEQGATDGSNGKDDEANKSKKKKKMDGAVTTTAAAAPPPELLVAPLEAHIKAVLYNPHTRSRRQASAVFDFLATGGGGGDVSAAAAAGDELGSDDSKAAAGAAAVSCAAASAKYFFDAVKHKSGLGKLLEIAMTSLQLSFTNSVLHI
jgi:hypothetical protein